MNLSGEIVKTFPIIGNYGKYQLDELASGAYIAVISSGGMKSNANKFILQ
jgi:hypothetical protein